MASFAVPYVPVNTTSWGPPKTSSSGGDESSPAAPKTKFHNLPYAPFGRSDRIGKVADFTQPGFGTQQTSGRGGDLRFGRQYDRYRHRDNVVDNNEGFQYRADPNEDNFQLVDTTKSASGGKKFVAPAAKRRQQRSSLRQLNARRGAPQMGLDSTRFNQVSVFISFVVLHSMLLTSFLCRVHSHKDGFVSFFSVFRSTAHKTPHPMGGHN